jgi:hypothetical protein
MAEGRNVYRVLVGKHERKIPTGGWDQNGPYGDWFGGWSGFTWLRIGTGGGLL